MIRFVIMNAYLKTRYLKVLLKICARTMSL